MSHLWLCCVCIELAHIHFPFSENFLFCILLVLTLSIYFYTIQISTIDHVYTLTGRCRDYLCPEKEWVDISDYWQFYLSIDRFFKQKSDIFIMLQSKQKIREIKVLG